MAERFKTVFLVLALGTALALLAMLSAIPMVNWTSTPAGAAPMPAITPVAANAPLGGDMSALIKFYDGTVVTADGQQCRDLGQYRVIDLEYVIDQTDVNTVTVQLEHTNGAGATNATNTDGQVVVSANAADADALNRFDLYGVTTCVDLDVTNTSQVTVTVYGLARK